MYNTIKSFAQDDFIGKGSPSKDGICYYLCNYIDEKLWISLKDYEEGKQKARDFIPLNAINYAKAQNLLYEQIDDGYDNTIELKENNLYRMRFFIKDEDTVVSYDDDGNPKANHEVIFITGANRILLFDPNVGFLEFVGLNILNVMSDLKGIYNCEEVRTFGVRRIRSITACNPLGFVR